MFNKQAIALAFISKFVYGKEFFDIPLTKKKSFKIIKKPMILRYILEIMTQHKD